MDMEAAWSQGTQAPSCLVLCLHSRASPSRRSTMAHHRVTWARIQPAASGQGRACSVFEGKAWQWDEVRKEYYMHLFAIQQADLNMDNPLVREEVKKILKFWLDMGVDGFREDVITFISKKEGLPDDHFMPASKGIFYFNHGPHLYEYLEEFRRDVFDHYDAMVLAEAPMVSPKKALEYISEDDSQVLDMMIQFKTQEADCFFTDFRHMPFNLRKMKRAFSDWQDGLEGKGWNMLYIENHDHPRMVTRYGSEKYQKQSAKMLCAMYMFLKGTPFVYQGQEIGMTNWYPERADMYEDVQTIWQYKNVGVNKPEEKRLQVLWNGSRDSARTPVQWSAEKNAGFTTGTPWFYVNENYTEINVADQEADEDSVLNFYRKAIKLRKTLSAVRHGDYKEHFKSSKKLYTYTREDKRQKLLVVCSFTDKETEMKVPKDFDLSKAQLMLKNYENNSKILKPYEVRVYLLDK